MESDNALDPQWAPLAERIAALVDARLREAPRPPDQEFFDFDDAARIVGLTPKALREHVARGAGPRTVRPRGAKRMVRFQLQDLRDWMVEARRDDADEA